jgi:fructuronate reductase
MRSLMQLSRLDSAALADLAQKLHLPQYTAAEHVSGIVHIGIGAFHKAHQAVYTDDVLNKFGGDWRITAVSLRNPTARDQLAAQDCLYTLVEKSAQTSEYRLIGSIEKVLVAPENPQAVIAALADNNIKVVSLTITEKGYCQRNGLLDIEHPLVQQDLANPQNPCTMMGFIVAACALRRAKNNAGFTIMSCDNLAHNGKITRAVVLAFAEKVDAELALWINNNIAFCSTMVDRIVPATTADDIAETAEFLQYEDQACVVSEFFRQWVIEDNFCNDRPQWDAVGALLVNDVSAYETMKLRLLNGSHSALAYLGFLSGHDYIHQAIADPALASLIEKLMDNEVTPSLAVPNNFDLENYKISIRNRFANHRVAYKTTQVANDGSQKLPQRSLVVASELIAQGRSAKIIALVIAAWFRFLEGEDEQQNNYVINDPLAQQLVPLAKTYRSHETQQVDALINASGIFPDALRHNEEFRADIILWLSAFHRQGAKETIHQFLDEYI